MPGVVRVVFMGTPSFALPVLDALNASENVRVCGVFTPPDRPGGRGRLPISPPVKIYALELGLEVHQPPTLRSQQAQTLLSSLKPDIIVVAAYGRFLPPPVLNLPPRGCLNLHPSLLPRHRGPSPVVTTILEGDYATGVSLMLLDEGMDTGPVIASRNHKVTGNETAEGLTGELFQIGAALLMENLVLWAQGLLTARPQDQNGATVTRKVEREDGQADWSLSALDLERRLRAYTPWPGLYSQWDGKLIKFLDVAAVSYEIDTELHDRKLPPGSVVRLAGPDPLGVVTGTGMLTLKTVQLEGRNSATAAEFLRGYAGFVGALL
ncbi:MAG: methionyl-tRNA formyltransferase [SAR202 cluster bacterium Io17-Chloro-G2]|nr:MAG: methionyl-tRNA formyltransferase [SAR202 cluster bacterium Io17-Chloro-G2]